MKNPAASSEVSKTAHAVAILVTPERFDRGPDSDSPGFPLKACGNDEPETAGASAASLFERDAESTEGFFIILFLCDLCAPAVSLNVR